jgi:hypothetical protein
MNSRSKARIGASALITIKPELRDPWQARRYNRSRLGCCAEGRI